MKRKYNSIVPRKDIKSMGNIHTKDPLKGLRNKAPVNLHHEWMDKSNDLIKSSESKMGDGWINPEQYERHAKKYYKGRKLV
jgi:hypothetical protein